MYNLEIGRRVLELYNKDNPRKLTAREFFDEVMFPLFFDVEIDSLQLMPGGNSAFGQPAYAKVDRSSLGLGQFRREKFRSDITGVISGKKNLGYSTCIGFSADDLDGTTTGQVSYVKGAVGEREVYLTWIGAACGIGIGGGANILIDNAQLLEHVFKGWSYYRRFLKKNNTFKGRQIETWNGLWVVYGFGTPDMEESYRRVMDKLPEHQGVTAKKEHNLAERPDWFKMFFSLAQSDRLPERMQAYAYKYGQMNTTLGFLTIELAPVKNLGDVFYQLLNKTYPDKYSYSAGQAELRKIFETHYSLSDMVALGGISIRTLRPAKVEAFMKAAKPQKTNDNPLYPILIKSWILAMLNNDELADLAHDLGLALRDIEINSRETATTKIEALLNAGSKPAFIMAANELKEHKGVIDAKGDAKKEILYAAMQVLKKAEDAAQRQIPVDQLPLFRALVKSDYLMDRLTSALKSAQLS